MPLCIEKLTWHKFLCSIGRRISYIRESWFFWPSLLSWRTVSHLDTTCLAKRYAWLPSLPCVYRYRISPLIKYLLHILIAVVLEHFAHIDNADLDQLRKLGFFETSAIFIVVMYCSCVSFSVFHHYDEEGSFGGLRSFAKGLCEGRFPRGLNYRHIFVSIAAPLPHNWGLPEKLMCICAAFVWFFGTVLVCLLRKEDLKLLTACFHVLCCAAHTIVCFRRAIKKVKSKAHVNTDFQRDCIITIFVSFNCSAPPQLGPPPKAHARIYRMWRSPLRGEAPKLLFCAALATVCFKRPNGKVKLKGFSKIVSSDVFFFPTAGLSRNWDFPEKLMRIFAALVLVFVIVVLIDMGAYTSDPYFVFSRNSQVRDACAL